MITVTGRTGASLWSTSPQGADAGCFADALLLVRSVLPAGLINDCGWERLLARTGRLPPSAADSMFGFEFRLNEEAAAADLLLSVRRDSPFAAALARERGSDCTAGTPLACFLSEWSRPGTLLADAVGSAALEYDIAGMDGSAAPGIFLCSASEQGYTDSASLTVAINAISGGEEGLPNHAGVARIMSVLPSGAAIRWAGTFPDRQPRAVRLLVRALGDGIAAFMDRAGFPGRTAMIDEVVSDFRARGVDNHVLALDVAEERVLPRFGLELSRQGRSSGWDAPLEMMVRRGWCRPEKAAALHRLPRSERIFAPSGVSEVLCGLHHVKLGFHADEGSSLAGHPVTAAKGYVACALRPFS